MVDTMSTLLTETAAATLLVVIDGVQATLTQLAKITGRSTSTVQRAVGSLLAAGALVRETPRGPVRLAQGAPHRALRELALWQLGAGRSAQLLARSRQEIGDARARAPGTITNPEIRAAWPAAIDRIVETAHPSKILLFGSQARGDAQPDSDVDFLVVVEPPVDKRELRVRVTRALADMPFAKDVMVASPAELESPAIGTAYVGAVREGVVVYER